MPPIRRTLPCFAAVMATAVAVLAAVVAGCGGGTPGRHPQAQARVAAVRPWAVQPPYLPPPDPASLAGARPAPEPTAAATGFGDRATASAGTADRAGRSSGNAGETDPAAPAGANAPTTTGGQSSGGASSGAPSDAEVARELRQAYGGRGGEDLDQAAIRPDGLAVIPATAPAKLVALMQGANEVARKPYVYGGGHGRNPNEIWTDTAYDCSGSVSYALAAAGYLDGPVDSSTLMSFGKPGPGKWVTIYANAGHTFMVVAGLRFDTSGRQVTGTRWQSVAGRSYAGFTVRHPPGL